MDNFSRALKLAREKRKTKLLNSKDAYHIIDLSQVQLGIAANSIANMPTLQQSVLFFKYGFNQSDSDIKQILGIQNIKGECLYLNHLLSQILNYKSAIMSEKSMQLAVEQAMKNVNQTDGELNAQAVGDYTFKNGKLSKRWRYKHIANFAIAIIAVVSIFFSINAFADGKLVNWVMQHFDTHSDFVFDQLSIDSDDYDFVVGYVPERFDFEKIVDSICYRYVYNLDNEFYLNISFVLKPTNVSLNTEGATINNITVAGNDAQLWQVDDYKYLMSRKNGVTYYIFGPLTEKEIIKIAENVRIINK